MLTTVRVQPEAQLPFAGLHQVLAPVRASARHLPAAHRDALRTAFGLLDGPPPEPFLVALAGANLVAAVDSPVVVLADDVHWLDPPSQEALTFLARRAEGRPVVVVGALRSGHPCPMVSAGLPELEVAAEPLGTRTRCLHSCSIDTALGFRGRRPGRGATTARSAARSDRSPGRANPRGPEGPATRPERKVLTSPDTDTDRVASRIPGIPGIGTRPRKESTHQARSRHGPHRVPESRDIPGIGTRAGWPVRACLSSSSRGVLSGRGPSRVRGRTAKATLSWACGLPQRSSRNGRGPLDQPAGQAPSATCAGPRCAGR